MTHSHPHDCRLWWCATLLSALACTSDGAAVQRDPRDWDAQRRRMVEDQIRGRGIRDERVLEAMRAVPRHLFIPESERSRAYADAPVPIGYGQTISQPFIVAFMTEALRVSRDHRVLEIGTGSGYQAAVLSALAREVRSMEIVEPLANQATATLNALGYSNVHVRTGNGYLGWPEHAPYGRIMVPAAPEAGPPALIEQRTVGGLMAIPVGSGSQELRILRRTPKGVEVIDTLPVLFVPMTGKPR